MLRRSLCALSVLTAILTAGEPVVLAQGEPAAPSVEAVEAEPIPVKEVVVTATRLPSEPKRVQTVPTNVTVITAQELRESGARTVQEALERATGIVLYDQIGNAFQQTIDLRGFNAQPVPAVSVFVDGVRINEPDFNTVNFNLIPLETIERIEILPGAAAIYGKNALAGAINIITRRDLKTRHVTAETAFGSFGRERYNMNAGGPVGAFDFLGNFTREIEDGFRDDSDARISRFFGKLGFKPTESTDLTLSYTYVKNNLKQAGTLPVSIAEFNPERNFTPRDFLDQETNLIRLNGRQTLPLGLAVTGNAFYRRLQEESFVVGQTSQSDRLFDVESWGGTVQLSHELDSAPFQNSVVAGGEFTRNDFADDFFGFFFAFPGFPTVTNTATDEDILALYAQTSLTLWSTLTLTGGARYDHDQYGFSDNTTPVNNNARRFSRVTPRAGITLQVTPGSSVYVNYTEGFRVPTVDELFTSRGTFGTSDPTLKPVRSRNYEIGARARIPAGGTLTVAAFQTDVRDEILTACSDPSCAPVASNQNVDKTRRRGIEATVHATLHETLEAVLNYTFTEATFRSSLVRNPFFAGGAPFIVDIDEGDTLPLVPKHRLAVTGTWRPLPGLTLTLSGLYVSTQFLLNDDGNARERLPGYFVMNARAAYERPIPGGQLQAFLSVNNLLNTEYFTFGIHSPNLVTGGGAVERFVMPQPGIAAFGGISYRFESVVN